jgi:hypothetical protein
VERYELVEGDPLPFAVRGEPHTLQVGAPLDVEPAVVPQARS